MLLILLIWIYTLTNAFLWGRVFRYVSDNHSGTANNFTLMITDFITGLAIITAAGNIWSVFCPVGPAFQLLLLSISLPGAIWLHKRFEWQTIRFWHRIKAFPPVLIVYGCLIFMTVWIKAACLSDNNDEGGYYLPLIRWIEQYPVVPGIANIEDRMGYNSNFHLLSAIFGFSWLDGKGFYDLGSLFFLMQQALSIRFLYLLLRGITFQEKWFYITAACSAWYVNPITLSSPDTDLAANALTWILITLFAEYVLFKKKGVTGGFFTFITLQTFFLATMRFSGVLLIALPVWLLLKKSNRRLFVKNTIAFAAIGCIMLIPWCYRNYQISGYAIYPLYTLDLFEPDWKVPVSRAKENYFYVRDYARRVAAERVPDRNRTDDIFQWLPVTFEKKTLVGKFFISFVLLFGIVLCFAFVLRWRWWRKHPDLMFFVAFLVFNLLVWLYAFPDIRFAASQLSITTVGTAVFCLLKTPFSSRIRFFGFIASLLMLIWGSQSCHILLSPATATAGILTPAPPFPADVRRDTLQGRAVFRTDGFSCGGTAPPCLNKKTPVNLIFRGESVNAGVRVKKF